MEPTCYHYYPLPMDDNSMKLMLGDRKLSRWREILLLLLVVGLLVTTITFAVQAYSPACKDGHRAEQECRNTTRLLEHQLTQAQEVLLQTEIQAATCNKTVVTLMASLKTEQAQGQKLQELVQELQEEIKKLKQKLQDTSWELQDRTRELEQLRNDHESFGRGYDSTSSGNTLSLPVAAMLLTLSLLVLLA